FASRARRFSAYAGVSCGPAAGPPARAPLAGGAPRPAGVPKPISQTPVKSGSFASAAQSAAVGAVRVCCCAVKIVPPPTATSNTAKAVERIFRGLSIFDPLYSQSSCKPSGLPLGKPQGCVTYEDRKRNTSGGREMTTRMAVLTGALVSAGSMMWFATGISAQSKPVSKSYTPPKTQWGDPNLQGTYTD